MVVNTDNDTFTYTHEYEVDNSSLIEAVYYNANDRSAVVDVNDQWYRYTGVDQEDVERLVNGEDENGSVGAHYNRHFKTKFGPGEHLGSWFDFTEVKEDVVTVPSFVANPNKESYGDGQPLFVSDETKEYSLAELPSPSRAGVEQTGESQDYTSSVIFTLGDNDVNEYTFEANSWNAEEAVQELHEYIKRLGMTGRVRRVVVKFE
jgi:hypothetical protein